MAVRILVVDNYDSFVYNLVQYLGQLGAEPLVRRNDELSPQDLEDLRPAGILISPGPGRPADAGNSLALVTAAAGRYPLLGVCLGHQCIGEAFGGSTIPAAQLMHGKTSTIHHAGQGVFESLPNPLVATRYHSLVVSTHDLPEELEVVAWSEDGTIMGLRHRHLPVEGVQFHPESILTEGGHHLLANWLVRCGHPGALAAVSEAARAPASRS